jgi:hypothetical protein
MKYSTMVSKRPVITVPHKESSGFFMIIFLFASGKRVEVLGLLLY